jgi:hypothetical protein
VIPAPVVRVVTFAYRAAKYRLRSPDINRTGVEALAVNGTEKKWADVRLGSYVPYTLVPRRLSLGIIEIYTKTYQTKRNARLIPQVHVSQASMIRPESRQHTAKLECKRQTQADSLPISQSTPK